MVVLDLFESGLATKLLRSIDGGNSGESVLSKTPVANR